MADSKRFKRQLLAMLLSLTMLLTFFPVSAFADNDSAGTSQLLDKMSEVTEPVNDEGEKEPDVYEQQLEELQRDAKAEAKLYFSKGSDAEQLPSFDDYQKALQYVRSQMVIRENNIDIVVTDAVYQQMDMGEMEDGCQDVLEHTGNPKEGDSFNLVYNTASGEKLSDSSWKVSYYFAYWDDYEQTVAVDAEAEKLVTQLGLKDSSKSDYDKVKAIYDYITANVRYNYDALDVQIPDAHNAYGAFVLHYCVCQGYALMFYRLCLEAGLDCRYIVGNVGELHAWNIVKVDGKWYLADTTWDAGVSADEYSYFLRGKYDFGHANTDDNFHRIKGFAEKYPVSDYKYGFSFLKVEAPEYTLITLDKKTVTTTAENGRAKMLIFFSDRCVFSTALLNEMSGKSFPGVDIIAADYGDDYNTADIVGNFLPANIPGVYCDCENSYYAMHKMEELTGIRDPAGFDASPTIFLINKDNKIIYAAHGLDNGLLTMIENTIVDPDAPPPQEDTTDYGPFIKMGICGDNAVWRFYSNGTLRISGKGPLLNIHKWYNTMNWYKDIDTAYHDAAKKDLNGETEIEQFLYCDEVKHILIDEGITYLGVMAFAYMSNVESVHIPASVTTISDPSLGYGGDIVSKEAVIYGWNNTAASRYCEEFGNPFISLDNNPDSIDYYAGATLSVEGTKSVRNYLPKVDEPNVYTLLTYDKKEIKTKAENGRGKVFIFYDTYWGYNLPNSLFDQLEQTDIPYADVYFICNPDCKNKRLISAKETAESIYPQKYRNYFCLSITNNLFYDYLDDNYNLDYPVNDASIVIMDGDSNIVYAEYGLPKDLPALVNSLVTHKGTVTPEEPVDYGDFEKIGVCGDQAVWRYYSDGTLHISGKGNLWDNISKPSKIGIMDSTVSDDFQFVLETVEGSDIKRVIIDDGITYIGERMFEGMPNLEYVEIPASVVKMPSELYYQTFDYSANPIIYGKLNSCAEQFAHKQGITFKAKDSQGHIYDETIVAPTCTTDGTRTFSCSKCNETCTETINALGHDYHIEKVVQPTCTAKGYTLHKCSRCGDECHNNETDMINHHFTEWSLITEPTCNQKGVEARWCRYCSKEETRDVDKIDHQYTEWTLITEPTCNQKGVEARWCWYCSKEETREVGDPLGHDYVEAVVPPTCTEKGYTLHKCSRCGDEYTDTETDMIAHEFGDWTVTTRPTCIAKGVETRNCVKCNKTETRDVNALGHDYVETVVPPTCTEKGYTLHKCSRCGDEYKENYTDAAGHKWSEWKTTAFDTTKNTSTSIRTCSVCFKQETQTTDNAIQRLAGAGRYATAVEISKAGFPNGAKTVVLAFGLNYADALAGVSLAKALNAPILLTNTKALPSETLDEIKRLKATDVIILGGTGAIDASVEKVLKQNGLKTERIAGGTRFETATKIAEKMQKLSGNAPEDIFFVYAFNSADALSVSAVAAVKGSPVIYLKTKGELDDATAVYLKSVKGKVKNAYVIGGTGVITDEMMKKAGDALGVKATRVFGKDRFETCVAVNEKFADVLNGDSICVATGMDFPDALAGGVFAALNKAPLFLINGKVKTLKLSDTQSAYMQSKAPQKIYTFGGVGAVPDSHVQAVSTACVTKANSNTLYVKDGLLYIDESILGMTYAEVNEYFGGKLPATEDWQWDAAFDSYLGYEFNGKGYILFFKDNILKAVRYEIAAGTITDKMLSTYKANFGAYTQRADGNGYRFSAKNSTLEVYDNYYDNTSHIVLQYSIK